MLRRSIRVFILLALTAVLAAFFLRFNALDHRPLHGDEAVNAYKLGEIIEEDVFRYDPYEYHGPALYFFSYLLTKVLGKDRFAFLDEWDLRILPVTAGLMLLLLPLFYRKFIGWELTLSSVFLLSFSAPLLFYSRYYIHEPLFALFIYLLLFQIFSYLKQPGMLKAAGIGVSTAMVLATKETWLVIFPAIAGASAMFLYLNSTVRGSGKWIQAKYLIAALMAFMVIFVLMFSWFFRHTAGITEAIAAIPNYFQRGVGDSVHNHPWYTYFSWLFFYPSYDGTYWTEAAVFLLSLTGIGFLLWEGKTENPGIQYLQFIAFYGYLSFFLFSLIPYKTPWNLLTFYPAILVTGAFGIIQSYRWFLDRKGKMVFLALIVMAGIHFIWQSLVLNFRLDTDPGNPYVYAHPLPDVVELASELDSLAAVSPDGYNIPIQIIIPGNDYWPLPWYLRRFRQTGWLETVPEEGLPAPVIISEPDLDSLVIPFLYDRPPPGQKYLYAPLMDEQFYLRPGKPLHIYIRYNMKL